MLKINKKIKRLINSFYVKKEEFNLQSSIFELEKKEFYNKMEEFWKVNKIQDEKISDEKFSVSRVQSVNVDFDIEKLENALKQVPDILNQVILKQYEIIDINGLIKYLKKCGVSSSKFKSFLSIKKSVDKKSIDNLVELGKIDKEILSGTYTVTVNNPYFKIKYKEDKNEGVEE